MGKITVETCGIEGLKVITPTVFGDARGYFMETYQYEDFKAAGVDVVFVQDNQSASKKGVLRGLHFQINHPQDKLVRVIKGEVFDVAVDLRKDSPTFGQWHGVLLSEENKIVMSEENPDARRYLTLPFACNLVSYGNNIVASVQKEYEDVVRNYINNYSVAHCFETPNMHVLNDEMQKYGLRVCFMAEYFLPDVPLLKELDCHMK